jgi:hypothetical protein
MLIFIQKGGYAPASALIDANGLLYYFIQQKLDNDHQSTLSYHTTPHANGHSSTLNIYACMLMAPIKNPRHKKYP